MTNLKSRMDRLEAITPVSEAAVTGIWLCGPDDEPSTGRCAYLPIGKTDEGCKHNRQQAYGIVGLRVPSETTGTNLL